MNSRHTIVAGLLQQPDSPNRVACSAEGCDATTLAPKLGTPAGWELIFRNGAGFTFVCPSCLDAIEAEYVRGGCTCRPGSVGGSRRER